MTIEQAAQQLAEAVKTMQEVIKDDDASCIRIHDSIRIFVIKKEVFKSIDSQETSIDWNGNSREFIQVIKRVGDVEFYTLIKVTEEPTPTIPIPPDVAEKAMDLLGRGRVV